MKEIEAEKLAEKIIDECEYLIVDRGYGDLVDAIAKVLIQTRLEALEEAAKVAEEWLPTENPYPIREQIADQIRTLAKNES